jgi:hypothetical protein
VSAAEEARFRGGENRGRPGAGLEEVAPTCGRSNLRSFGGRHNASFLVKRVTPRVSAALSRSGRRYAKPCWADYKLRAKPRRSENIRRTKRLGFID